MRPSYVIICPISDRDLFQKLFSTHLRPSTGTLLKKFEPLCIEINEAVTSLLCSFREQIPPPFALEDKSNQGLADTILVS